MKSSYIEWILVVAYFSATENFGHSSALTFPERNSLRLRILEFDQSGTLVQVLSSRNSDIIYGEDVSDRGVIMLECRSSSGPVTLSYQGDGAPDFTTNTNTTRTSRGLHFWTFLKFSNHLSAEDSGNYTCSGSLNDPVSQNSVHLFVPDSTRSVFVPSRQANRLEYPKENYLRIPCSVVHPGARVTLEKLSETFRSVSRFGEKITYSPKTGFYIPVSMVNSKGPTTFLCKSSFRGKHDQTEYKIYSEIPESEFDSDTEQLFPISPRPTQSRPSSSLRSACTGSTCGKNAECIVIDYAAHCVCYENYNGDPWKVCNPMSQQSQQYNQEDPCSPNPCGRNNPCIPVNRHAVCTCEGNHEGTPTICRPTTQSFPSSTTTTTSIKSKAVTSAHCINNNDCAWDEYCNQNSGFCDKVCRGTNPFCGQNAKCISLNHAPLCECVAGFSGNPYVSRISHGCVPATTTTRPNQQEVDSLQDNKCRHDKSRCFINKPKNSATIPRPTNISTSLNVGISKDLCKFKSCGVGAECRVIGSQTQCFCPARTRGNPAIRCDPVSDADIARTCDTCGPNSVCTITGRKVFCECALNATGIPPNCVHPKQMTSCRDNFDCSDDKVCDRGRCLNPCSWMCSDTANCTVLGHKVKCQCPPGHEGDPRFGCRRMVKAISESVQEGHPCTINCGANTVCRAVMFNELEKYRNNLKQSRHEALYFDMIRANGNLKREGVFSECLCRKGFHGNPYALSGCKPGVDEETLEFPVTIVMEPINPCEPTPCGSNSFCRSHNGKAFCSCDFDSSGQPPNCKHICQLNSHCMFNESCVRGLCQKSSAKLA